MVDLTPAEVRTIEEMLSKMQIPAVHPTLQAFAMSMANDPNFIVNEVGRLASMLMSGCECWHCKALTAKIRERPGQALSGMDLYYRIILQCCYPDIHSAADVYYRYGN